MKTKKNNEMTAPVTLFIISSLPGYVIILMPRGRNRDHPRYIRIFFFLFSIKKYATP
jgi:hypothetical protein